jgi:hypothetical protein
MSIQNSAERNHTSHEKQTKPVETKARDRASDPTVVKTAAHHQFLFAQGNKRETEDTHEGRGPTCCVALRLRQLEQAHELLDDALLAAHAHTVKVGQIPEDPRRAGLALGAVAVRSNGSKEAHVLEDLHARPLVWDEGRHNADRVRLRVKEEVREWSSRLESCGAARGRARKRPMAFE